MLMLQWGAGVSNVLSQLEQLGFFAYVLPFLLIFAVVYAILTTIDIFKNNKGAGVLVAAAIGLLALQLNVVSLFFQDIFPKFGIGIALLLVALILAGGFIPGETKAYNWIFFGVGGAIFLVIMLSSLSSYKFIGINVFEQYGALIIVLIVVVGAVVGVILASKKQP